MKSNITAEQAKKVALNYMMKYKLDGKINDNTDKSVMFYEEFDGVEGPAWLVTVEIEPHPMFAENEYTIVISDVKASVEYIFDPNGHPTWPHLR
jgi:hypothetical protein